MKVGDLVQVTWVDAVEGRIGLVTCETVGFVSVLNVDFITINQTRTVEDSVNDSQSLTTIPRSSIQTSRALEVGRKRTIKKAAQEPKETE